MLQRYAIQIIGSLAIALSSLTAMAGNFDFVPTQTGAEKELRTLLENGNFRLAFITWNSAFGSSRFAQSQTGKATWAYLVLKNGMPFTASEFLMSSTEPNNIDSRLLNLWTAEFKSSMFVQKGWIQTEGKWKTIVMNDPFSMAINNASDVSRAFKYADKYSDKNPNESARVLWQIATQAPQFNNTSSSLSALAKLKSSGQTVIGQDLIAMAQGRVLYQKGQYTEALAAYDRIPKSSSLWVEAVEERAWAYTKKEDYDKATGTILTALSPVFAPITGPESYFLSNLLALRVCDYNRMFRTSEVFKTRHRARLVAIQSLAQKGTNAQLVEAFDKIERSGVNLEAVGPLIEFLPRGIFRDTKFTRSMETRRQLLNEINTATQLLEQSSALGSSDDLNKAITNNRNNADKNKQIGFQRVRQLAQADVAEYKAILNKMHIIEAEAIERLHLDENLKGERSKLSKMEDDKESLVFPFSPQEVWMDELDNYQARVKDCPTLKGASL